MFEEFAIKSRKLTESNAFCISTVTRRPSSGSVFAIFIISEITLSPFLTNAV